MKTLTTAERLQMTQAVLNPEDGSVLLSLREVAEMTNRDVRVIRHFTKKKENPLPTTKVGGRYFVRAEHVAYVLWQPAWSEKRPIKVGDRRFKRTVMPGTTPTEDELV